MPKIPANFSWLGRCFGSKMRAGLDPFHTPPARSITMLSDKSPFPGMNPWLEAHWGDIHTRLTTYAADQIQTQLPEGLRARVEEYVTVESSDEDDVPRRYAPDVRVIESHDAPQTAVGATVALEDEPLRVRRLCEPETLHTITIFDAHANERVITSIEFISLANKSNKAGRRQYIGKRDRMLAGGVSIVEIDLLRNGGWVVAIPENLTPDAYCWPYRICVVRAGSEDVAELYRADFRRPLPTVRIPLRETDDDVKLQLQPLIDTAYVNGRYGEELAYTRPPNPELTGCDAEWVAERLRAMGLV